MAISQPFLCDLLEMQPGQPGGADWSLRNVFEEQPLKFQMKVEGYGFIENPQFYTKKGLIKFRYNRKRTDSICFLYGREAWVTDRNFKSSIHGLLCGKLSGEKIGKEQFQLWLYVWRRRKDRK